MNFYFNPSQKSLISKNNNTIYFYDGFTTIKTREAWERELGLTFDEQWWDSAVRVIHRSSICARMTLIQFKVLYRCHF